MPILSSVKSDKKYLAMQWRYANDLLHVQVPLSTPYNRDYGLSMDIKRPDVDVKGITPGIQSLAGGDNKYYRGRIRPTSSGNIHIQIVCMPINRAYGFAGTWKINNSFIVKALERELKGGES